MKSLTVYFLLALAVFACQPRGEEGRVAPLSILGTWELIDVVHQEGDNITNTFSKDRRMIKMINPTHFSFVSHDLNKGSDSLAYFGAGAGNYSLDGNKYVEQLEFCTARGWEGHTFEFEVRISGDTLIQQGVEKSEQLGVDRYIIETYIRTR